MSDEEYEAFMGWMNEGVDRGWVSLPVCSTHEGLPMTPEEDAEWDEGYDPCMFGIRLWFT